ncbi:MAG: glycoside hydrolase family 2 TIM barrel-domain containing protein, partial [Bacteroidota bacterium]
EKTDTDGTKFMAYGGDFGEEVNDNNFLANGLLYSDRTPQPKLYEAKHAFQPVTVSKQGEVYMIKSWLTHTNLNQYDLEVRAITLGGAKVLYKEAAPDVGAGAQVRYAVKGAAPAGTCYLEFAFLQRVPEFGRPAGHEVAFEQFALPQPEATGTNAAPGQSYQATPAGLVLLEGKNEVSIDPKTGVINNVIIGGNEILAAPLKPNFWRAPTDNDKPAGLVRAYAPWRTAEPVLTDKSYRNNELTLTRTYLEGKVTETVILRFTDDQLHVRARLAKTTRTAKVPGVFRYGMQTAIDKRYGNASWFGRGPVESYADRYRGTRFGRYSLPISKLNTDYIKPAENGNRMDVSRLTITGDGLPSLRVLGDFNFSIWPYTQATLEAAEHTNELTEANTYTLNIDYGQIGVGGDNSWMPNAAPYKEHRLELDRPLSYRFSLGLK